MKCVATAVVLVTGLALGVPAWAQDSPNAQDVRPAVTSFWGDTGLWFVPTAEVLKGGWAFGAYRTEMDFKQGSTDASYYPGTFAIGAGSRTEIFGAVRAVTAIDRDTRPLFSPATSGLAGVVNEYPLVRDEWTGSNFGDVYVGTKVNLLSEYRRTVGDGVPRNGEAADRRRGQRRHGSIRLLRRPRGQQGDQSSGRIGRLRRPRLARRPDGHEPLGWGALGRGCGVRCAVKPPVHDGTARGSADRRRHRDRTGALVGIDGSLSPVVTELDSRVNVAAGLTWQHPSGMSIGIGTNYRFGIEGRSGVSLQLRLGFHSGVRIFTAPPPLPPRPPAPRVEAPPPPAPVVEAPRPPPPPVPPPNRPPTVRAQCDPCRVEVGQTVTLRVTSQDRTVTPDRSLVGAVGTITDPRAATTQWRAQTAPGKVVLTVTADDGRGGRQPTP